MIIKSLLDRFFKASNIVLFTVSFKAKNDDMF
jgi:hypothetical protein